MYALMATRSGSVIMSTTGPLQAVLMTGRRAPRLLGAARAGGHSFWARRLLLRLSRSGRGHGSLRLDLLEPGQERGHGLLLLRRLGLQGCVLDFERGGLGLRLRLELGLQLRLLREKDRHCVDLAAGGHAGLEHD